MYKNENECIIRCSCQDISHPVHLYLNVDDWDLDAIKGGFINDVKIKKNSKYKFCDLSITLQVENVGFFERIRNSFFYIFKQRKFWHYGDINLSLLTPEGDSELRHLITFLAKTLKHAEECKRHNDSITENNG